MRGSNRRRSERVPAAHRLMLTILGPSGAEILKEIVTTVDISRHGASIRGRRTLQPDWKGNLVQLSSCRQVPFRVAWQVPSVSDPGYFDTGVEILATTEFWGRAFSNFSVKPENPEIVIENSVVPPVELLEEIQKGSKYPEGERFLEAIWCGLIEQLEERRVFTRTELVSTLRKIGFDVTRH